MSSSLRLHDVGATAVLADVADPAEARSLAAFARAALHGPGPSVAEIVPGAESVLLDGVEGGRERLAQLLAGWEPGAEPEPGPLVAVPVVYDGPDLADVARRWGTDEAGVVARHTATVFVSAFCGFAPGFAYLAGLPEAYAVPRLDSPRSSVPAGSVGLAGSWCGVYPTSSPGGWRLLGRTGLALWDPARPDPALLAPGTRVRFVAA